MNKYDPCTYCANLCGGVPDRFGDERCVGCLYFESVKEHEQRIEKAFEKLDSWEDIFRETNQPSLASVVRTISHNMKSILLKQ